MPRLEFERRTALTARTLVLDYEYRSLEEFVPIDEVNEYLKRLNEAAACLNFTVAPQ